MVSIEPKNPEAPSAELKHTWDGRTTASCVSLKGWCTHTVSRRYVRTPETRRRHRGQRPYHDLQEPLGDRLGAGINTGVESSVSDNQIVRPN